MPIYILQISVEFVNVLHDVPMELIHLDIAELLDFLLNEGLPGAPELVSNGHVRVYQSHISVFLGHWHCFSPHKHV